MLDLTKQYRTRTGKRVIALQYNPKNWVGNPTTFPIKGSIVVREKPLKLRYQIWCENGKAQIHAFGDHPDDLVEVTTDG